MPICGKVTGSPSRSHLPALPSQASLLAYWSLEFYVSFVLELTQGWLTSLLPHVTVFRPGDCLSRPKQCILGVRGEGLMFSLTQKCSAIIGPKARWQVLFNTPLGPLLWQTARSAGKDGACPGSKYQI